MKDAGVERPYSALIEENRLKMTGIEMVYVFDNSSYMNLRSESAFADRVSSAVSLEKVSIKYGGRNINLDADADRGTYELQRVLRASGNITGSMNDMEFKAGEDGTLTYDYKDGKGAVENGITLNQGENNIKAGRADFNVNDNYVLFSDNVSVEYFAQAPEKQAR